MIGGARIRTQAGADGRTRIVELAASAPLGIKMTGDHEVHLIGTAAAPMDGDVITIEVEVGAGTQLRIGTVAATMAWPARGEARPSVMEVRAVVEEGGTLCWLPEQLVPVMGCRHVLRCEVELAPTASVLWREEVVLGRAGEPPGELDAELRVVRAGTPLLHQHLRLDGGPEPLHGAPSLLAGAQATGSVLAAGPGVPEYLVHTATPELRGAVLELEAGGRLASATATSTIALRRWLAACELGLTPPGARTAAAACEPLDSQEILTR